MERWFLFLAFLLSVSLTLAFLVSPPPAEKVVVVVDAGHGGRDPGAVAAGIQEKDLDLALALVVQKKAQDMGLKVILTRTTDVHVDLVERVRLAEAVQAALYVSIHANYHRDPKVCGIETWVDVNANGESMRLAHALQRALVLVTGAQDRGVRRQPLYLRHTSLPTAVVEVGYLSCPSEREKLLDPVYQEQVAEGVLRGILSYLGS